MKVYRITYNGSDSDEYKVLTLWIKAVKVMIYISRCSSYSVA